MNTTGSIAKVIVAEKPAVPESSPPALETCPHEASPVVTEYHTPPAQEKAVGKPIVVQGSIGSNSRAKWASLLLGLIGAAILGISLIISYAGTFSQLLSLEGASLILIAVFVYFVTPGRLVQGDVCDAETISSVELASAFIALAAGDAKGIYWPPGNGGGAKVFIPTGDRDMAHVSGNDVLKVRVSGIDGLLVNPPGSGLFQYAKSRGASFTDEGLEDQIRDVLVNGTELASRVEMKREADEVRVRITGLAGQQMCRTMRQKYPAVCYQAGCPVCSFVSCMVVEGTGKPAMVSEVKPEGQALDIAYKLM